ncbi:MAG: TonB-dependent receptor [Williamsia sp.]|nr:TonB-dependent receptor [Williamsia sp.]
MKPGSLILVALFSVLQLFAQKQDIRGTVTDAVTGQPISFGSVVLLHARSGAMTDAKGQFRLTLFQNTAGQRLVISSVGYESDTVQLSFVEASITIQLTPLQNALNNVVVTGVSRATLVRENPAPVALVSAKRIERSMEANVIDVLVKNVPGLTAVKTGPNVSKPFIRGLGYNRVLTLYDGIRQEGQQWGDEHGIEVDAYNIDRAEVIKGPASIMYGSDALAGVVSLIPVEKAEQKNKLVGKWVSEYQSNNGLIGNGLRLMWAGNRWTYRASGSYRIAGNYSNRIEGKVHNTGFRETNLTTGLQYKGSRNSSTLNFTLYDNLQGIPDGSRDSLSRAFTRQVYEAIHDKVKDRPLVPASVLNSYGLSPLHQHIQHYRLYSNQHYETTKGDIDLQLAFQQNIRREYNHPTLPQQAGMHVRLNTVNYGIRYNTVVLAKGEVSLGVNGMYQHNKSRDATDFPIPDYRLLDAGAYIFTKWKQGSWTLSGGARYDIRRLQGHDFYTLTDTLTGFTSKVPTAALAGAVNQFPAFDKLFRGLSLSIGTTYQVSESFYLKANIARGYRAPGITEFASNGLDPGAHIIYLGNRHFGPEFSLQEDIGADLHNRNGSLSVSLFNNWIRHYIYLSQLTDANGVTVTDAQGNKTYQYQQAAAQLYGMEAVLTLHPARIKGLQLTQALSAIYGYNRKQGYNGKGINGAYLPLIPPLKWVSNLSHTFTTGSALFSEVSTSAEAEYNAAQNRFLALDNTETATPAYTLFSISLGTKIKYAKSHAVFVQVQVNNLFNKAYQSALSRLKYFEYYNQPAGRPGGIYNMGRNACVKAVVDL